MVQKRVLELVDDLDGGTANETVAFSLDGKLFEIDLSSDNAGQFRKVLEPYLLAARKVGAVSAARIPRQGSGRSDVSSAVIRQWARENGYPVNNRGRIPAEILAAYESR